jgi:hypothetical protein
MKSLKIYKKLINRVYRRSKPKVILTLPITLSRINSSLYLPHLEVRNGYQGFESEVNGQVSREVLGLQYLNPNSTFDTSFLEADGDSSTEEDFSEKEISED